jgi:hypothetical protein
MSAAVHNAIGANVRSGIASAVDGSWLAIWSLPTEEMGRIKSYIRYETGKGPSLRRHKL